MVQLKTWVYVLAIVGVLAVMGACNRNTADLPAPTAPLASVAYYNLIPTTLNNAIDFYVNGTRQNSNAISYGYSSGYMSMISGQQSIGFKYDSLRVSGLYQPFFDPINYTILTNSSTIFVTGTSANNLIYSRDTIAADTAKKNAQVRFINAAPDAPAYDLYLNKVGITNQAYKSISTFARPDTGAVVMNLNLAGTNTTVLTRTLTFASYGVYTVFVYGSAKNTAIGLNFGVITNH